MPVLLPVERLVRVCDPFTNNPWVDEPLCKRDVLQAIGDGRLRAQPFSTSRVAWGIREHVERIAWLVVHGWADAVDVDVGVPALHCHVLWPLTDGNHRLAAAVVREDDFILASVGGDIDHAAELFGVDVAECPDPACA